MSLTGTLGTTSCACVILHVASASASPYVSAKAASPTRGDPNVHAPTISAAPSLGPSP